MSILKSRKAAWCIFAVVVIVATFIGVTRTMNKLAKEVSDTFYNGVYLEDEKYTSASIDSHLSKRVDASLGLITVLSKYDSMSSLADDLRLARLELMDAGNIKAKSRANKEINNILSKVAKKASDFTLEDAALYSEYINTLNGAQDAIEMNKYNEKVGEFYKNILNTFPARLFAGAVSRPEYFS